MKIVIAGGTGFVGGHLCRALGAAGHEVVLVSRAEGAPPAGAARVVSWGAGLPRELEGAGAVVNLAGAGIADRRWTARRKREILESRVGSTRRIVEALRRARKGPRVLVNASAVGYYGDRGGERLTESSTPGGGFLAQVCLAWEAEAAKAKEAGARVVCLRLGVVLGRDGGALPRMLRPFKLGFGGPLGSGRQYMSWVHVDDAVGLARFALDRAELDRPLNAVAPSPVTNREFSRALGAALRRPSWLVVPAFGLRLALGELADVLLEGQRAEPVAALERGYRFAFPDLGPALSALVPGTTFGFGVRIRGRLDADAFMV